MIEDNKKLNPFIGIAIGVFLIFFGMFGALFLFGEILSQGLFMLVMGPFIIVGVSFLFFNASYLGIRRLARKIDESAELIEPKTSIHSTCAITKVRNLYIVKFKDNYLHVIRMNERTNISASWYRRTFGPKLPTSLPLKCPVLTEFQGFKIRKCEGTAKLYDIDEHQWVAGQATMYSIFFFTEPMSLVETIQYLRGVVEILELGNC